jgi:hypothetical protein
MLTTGICGGKRVELCPRSYDVLQRAELGEVRVQFQGMQAVGATLTPLPLHSHRTPPKHAFISFETY